ncbi:MAG TPA: GNAT family N-acetyltransferase [Jatrophihabitantaceae bacterium]|jgi:ElaA protein|nr:GNAT family N-acetyltransferase [Jatrophihabitantaceae bacterium]
MDIHRHRLNDIAPVKLYQILALRMDVFVVEQGCPYRDLDGRDTEGGSWLLWAEQAGTVTATLRTLTETGPDGTGETIRIGRVATAIGHRGRGLAAQLIEYAIASAAGRPMTLDAQVRLESWYEGFGFRRSGPDFDEDGMAHVPMRRPQ